MEHPGSQGVAEPGAGHGALWRLQGGLSGAVSGRQGSKGAQKGYFTDPRICVSWFSDRVNEKEGDLAAQGTPAAP